MSNNATDEPVLHENEVAINTIQQAIYVERMPIIGDVYSIKKTYLYDKDDLYPQKALSISDRSWSLDTATKTLSDFIRGDGWADEDLNEIEINEDKMTAFDILKMIGDIKSKLGFAVQLNYNIQLQISEINYIDFENLRVRIEDDRLEWRKDWRRTYTDEEIIYDRFNPDPEVVREQISDAGGIEKWNGQVLYWTGVNDVYPKAKFDSVLDDGQYQAEQKLDSLRNIQNGFPMGGVFTYPKSIQGTAEGKQAEALIKAKGTGANNSGRIITIAVPAGLEGADKLTTFVPFDRQNIDDLYVNQNEGAFQSIFSNFRQPLILNSITESGVFNQEQYNDAIIYYNTITELERKEVEKAMKPVWENSIWSDQIQMFEIKPKPVIIEEEVNEVVEEKTETEVTVEPENTEEDGAE